MSTLRTSNLIHGSSAISNVVLDTSGRALFGPDGPNGRAALYVNPQTNRVGVNTESPAVALDVDGAINTTGNVTVGGTLNLTGDLTSDVINAGSGTAAAPSVSVGTTDNGLYSPGTDQVAISTNGTGRLFVDSSGNVGIGTTAPVQPLEVVTATGGGIALRPSSGNATQGLLFYDTGGGPYGFVKYDNQLSALSFGTVNSERARIDSSGRLLVGTFSTREVGYGDNASLQLEGTSYPKASIALIINSNNVNGPSLNFAKSRGTSNGSSTVVQNDDVLGVIAFCGADGTDIRTMGARIQASVDGTPGANDMPGRLVFSTTADGASSPTERMRIDSSGNVDIGLTSAVSKLDVKGYNAYSGTTPYNYLYSTNGSIRVIGAEASLDLVSSAAGSHASSVLLRGGNKGFALMNNDDENRLEINSFTADADEFNVHAASGENLSAYTKIAYFNKTGLIQFPGPITIGGTDAINTLDEYEEGTWTPTVIIGGSSAGITYKNNTGGSYTRIGRLVFIHVRMDINSKGSNTGNVAIGNLPYPAANIQSGNSAIEVSFAISGYSSNGIRNSSLTNATLGGTVSVNENKIALVFHNLNDGSSISVNNNSIVNGSSFSFDFSYQIA